MPASIVVLGGIPGDVTVVTVHNREADIDLFTRKALPEENPVLIWEAHNRQVSEGRTALFALVESSPGTGRILIGIPRNTRSSLPPRQATLAVKLLRATLWPTFGKPKMTIEKPAYVVHAK